MSGRIVSGAGCRFGIHERETISSGASVQWWEIAPTGEYMAEMWKVISNSGQHAVFERGLERLDIDKPKDGFARKIFMGIRPGTLIDDGTIALIRENK